MIRTIVQLTEEQSRTLKEMSAEYNMSVSELIRRSVDLLTQTQPTPRSREGIRQRAIAAAGFIKDPSGPHDLAASHDAYLEEIYAEENQVDDDLH
jgi:hypothetical protein